MSLPSPFLDSWPYILVLGTGASICLHGWRASLCLLWWLVDMSGLFQDGISTFPWCLTLRFCVGSTHGAFFRIRQFVIRTQTGVCPQRRSSSFHPCHQKWLMSFCQRKDPCAGPSETSVALSSMADISPRRCPVLLLRVATGHPRVGLHGCLSVVLTMSGLKKYVLNPHLCG